MPVGTAVLQHVAHPLETRRVHSLAGIPLDDADDSAHDVQDRGGPNAPRTGSDEPLQDDGIAVEAYLLAPFPEGEPHQLMARREQRTHGRRSSERAFRGDEEGDD